jgi:hypothetical protein
MYAHKEICNDGACLQRKKFIRIPEGKKIASHMAIFSSKIILCKNGEGNVHVWIAREIDDLPVSVKRGQLQENATSCSGRSRTICK